MRRIAPWALAALLVPALAAAQPAPAPAARTKVAVLDLRPIGVEASLAELLSEVALTEAASLHYLEVIGRSDIQSMLGFEKQKKILGCEEDSACIAEIGGALGVKFVLVGSVGKIGTLYRLDLKAIDTGKAGAVRRKGVNVEGAEEKMVAAVQGAVRDLFQAEANAAGPAPAVAAAPPPAAPKPAPAAEDEPPQLPRDPHWLFGVRLAYAGPGGEVENGVKQNDLMGGQGVLQFDGTYRLGERFSLGAYVSVGSASPGKNWESDCKQTGETCTISVKRIGITLRYDFAAPTATLVPYVGAGAGFEALDFTKEWDGNKVTVSASGWEPINLEAGVDARVGVFRLGPYFAFGLGRYNSYEADLTDIGAGTRSGNLDPANHSYFYLGLRGALEL